MIKLEKLVTLLLMIIIFFHLTTTITSKLEVDPPVEKGPKYEKEKFDKREKPSDHEPD